MVSARTAPRLPGGADLVGRADDLAHVWQALDACEGPLTIVGPPGGGKSALALAAVRRWAERPGSARDGSRAGVWVDLARARTADDVHAAFVASLGLPSDPQQDGEAALVAAIRRLDAPLVGLDGADRVGQHAAALVERVGRAVPSCRWLVTARTPLGAVGEQVVRIDPLDHDAAVELFVRRARAVAPAAFVADADDVGRLVVALDRLPLAIELAAARAGVLSVPEMLEHLGQRGRWSGARPGAAGRGMDAALDWSWSSLPDAARHVLTCAVVFRHPCTLDAMRAVAAASEPERGAALVDALAVLHERSLLRVERSPGEATRYAVYAILREHVLDAASPQDLVAARQRHAEWFVARASALAEAVATAGEADALAAFETIRPDVLEALEHVAATDPGAATQALLAVESLLGLRLPHDAHMAWIARGLQLATEAGPSGDVVELRFRARRAIELLLRGRRADAAADLERIEVLCEEPRPDDVRQRVLHARVLDAYGAGDLDEARSRVDAARAFTQSCEMWDRDAGLCLLLGMIESALGDRGGDRRRDHYAAARAAYDEALAHYEPAGHVRACAAIYGNMGNLHLRVDERREQRYRYEQALQAARRVQNASLECVSLANLAWTDIVDRDEPAARARLNAAFDVAAGVGRPVVEALIALRFGVLEADLGRFDAAHHRWMDARTIAQRAGVKAMAAECDTWLAVVAWGAGRDGESIARLRDASRWGDPGRARVARRLIALVAGGPHVDEPLTPNTAPHLVDPATVERVIQAAESARDGSREALRDGVPRDASGDVSTDWLPFARVLAAAALGRLVDGAAAVDDGPTCVVFGDCAALQLEGGPRIDLARKRVVRRIARHLVDALESAPGEVQPVERLIEAGWPGETFVGDSATNRLYVAISALRQLGLDGALQTASGGYRLDPNLKVVRTS